MPSSNRAANSFVITQIIDGDSVQGALLSTKSLAQMYNPNTTNCVPDWTQSANQPIVYPNVYLASEGGNSPKAVTSCTWFYNGTAITFNSSNVSTNFNGAFQKLPSYSNGTTTVEALKIIKNLGSSSNTDNDVIRLEGSVEASGQNVSVAIEIGVRLAEFTDSGFVGVIDALDTTNNIATCQFDDDTSTIRLTASLYGSDGTAASSWSCKWYKNGGSTAVSTAKQYNVSKDAVDARATFRCDFIVSNEVVYSAYIDLYDLTDPYLIQISWTNGKTALGSGETATGTCTVKKSDGTNAPGTWTFTSVLTNASGATFSNAGATVSSAGAISVTYAAVVAAGGQITGYITASSS